MSRYIDADKLIKQIEADSKGNEGQYGDEWKFMDTIRSQPTADVEEITRCGACVFCEIRNNDEPICHKHYMVVDNDYYCADGVKGEWMP